MFACRTDLVHGAGCQVLCGGTGGSRSAVCQANGTWFVPKDVCVSVSDEESDPVSSSSSAPVAALVAGSLAGFVVLAMLLAFVLLSRRRSSQNKDLHMELQALVPQKVGQQLMLAYGHLFGATSLSAEEARFATLEVARRAVQLERLIGEGQSGSVFLGQLRSQGLRQPVAVKMGVVAGAAPSLSREEALQMEARLLHLLQHPHIVGVLAVVTHTQPTLLCLEYMVNGDLKTYLR
jgi:hypothetical protein